jgi:Protein of unknown function (DUF2867)
MNAQVPATLAEIPRASRIRHAYASTDLADAYEMYLPTGAASDPASLARFIFSNQPAWVLMLMQVRDWAVMGLGLKTAAGLRNSKDNRIGIFKIYESHQSEVIVGEDDKHLDFRVSVLHRVDASQNPNAASVVVSTVVHCHNRLGSLYIAVIAPFHRQVVKALLRRAALKGWPADHPCDRVASSPRRTTGG